MPLLSTDNWMRSFDLAFLPMLLNLLEPALVRSFFWTPTQKLGAVPEPASGEMVVADIAHQFWLERLPFAGTFRTPSTWSAGRSASKSRLANQRLDQLLQVLALPGAEAGGEADMIKQTLVVIESQ